MKITRLATYSQKSSVKLPTLLNRDLTTLPTTLSPRTSNWLLWNRRTNEIEIRVTGETIDGSTYDYTITLTVSDLLTCLKAALTPPKPTPQRRANKTKPVQL